MNHEGSIVLSHTRHGHVKTCLPGCVHLTFEQVTLHFNSEEEFEAMAASLLSEADACAADEAFDVQFSWFSMSLTPLGSQELVRLVFEAVSDLAWRRGELEFTDDDLRQIRRRCAS